MKLQFKHQKFQADAAKAVVDVFAGQPYLSGLKAIVAQCLASILRWKVSVIPEKLTQEKMFDVELYGLKTDEKKKVELSNKIENDSFLGYIVRAIKYASGIEE